MVNPQEVAASLAKQVKTSAAILEQQIDAQLAKRGSACIDIDKLDSQVVNYLKSIYMDAGWAVTISSGDQRDWYQHLNIQLDAESKKRGFLID